MNKRVLLLSNMYPSCFHPSSGTFVRTSKNDLEALGFTIDKVVIKNKFKNKFLKVSSYFSLYVRFLYKALTVKYDFYYGHYASHVAIPLVIISFFREVKIIVHVHGGDVKHHKGRNSFFFKIKKKLSGIIFCKAYHIIVPSQYYSEILKSMYSTNGDKIFIYPSGGINEYIKDDFESRLNNNVLKVGFAGRFVASKNVEQIIYAISKLRNITLELVGDGEDKKKLERIVNEENISESVTFISPMNQHELSIWYKNIDVLVYPSDSESLGLVPIEAMASGTIVILSNIPPFIELQKLGAKIFIVDKNEGIHIANKLKYISLLSSSECYAIRKINFELAFKHYSSTAVQEKLACVFI